MSAVYDIHTHDFPEVPGTSIVQLTPARYCLYPDHVYSVGLHPWDIEDDWRVQMAKVAVIAMHPHVLAIGEAGLDKKKSPVPMDVQKAVFREHVKLSEMLHKPLIVHCVKAVDELLSIRREMGVKHPWVLHGYRGGPEQAEQLRKQGIYVSLGLEYNTDTLLDMPLCCINSSARIWRPTSNLCVASLPRISWPSSNRITNPRLNDTLAMASSR